MVADVFAGVGGSSPAGLIAFGGRVFLTASDGANLGQHGTELWSTDGTPGGTVMVRDIAPGYQSSVPQGLTVY
jgi:ELWxxDGT repeat protein